MGKFARRCAKDGGFFKCCVSVWNLKCWEMARNKLVKEGLIPGNITKNCKRRKRDPCVVCKAEGVCTIRNILTGQVWFLKINYIVIVQYPLWPGSVHLSAAVQGGTQGGWS